MKYKKNDEMEFLDIDDENLAVYYTESGDTHYIGGTGKVILSMLGDGTDDTELIGRLCEIYSAAAGEIERDVTECLVELAEKKVVVCL